MGIESPSLGNKHEKSKPQESSALADLEFYVTDHSPDSSETGDRAMLKALYEDIKKDGVKSIRYDWRWNGVEKERGSFDGQSLDRYGVAVDVMHEVGLQPPTIVLSSIPGWALELYKKDKESFFTEYALYLEKVCEALKKTSGEKIQRVQVFNELNNSVYTPIAMEDIPRLCDITRAALREYNPDIKLMGTLFAGNLPGAIERGTLGKIKLGTDINEFLDTQKKVLDSFDILAVDYYPGMWHLPLQEARESKKEIFRQLGLLREVMLKLAAAGREYELGETGLPTNMPFLGKKHNEDRQRYFYDTFFSAFKHMLLEFKQQKKLLPKRIGLYEAVDEPPKTTMGRVLRKITPFPEHDLGMRRPDMSRKEILKGNRHTGEEERASSSSQLSRIIHYMNAPMEKR